MCQIYPAAPTNPAVTAARFPDNHVFLLNLSFSCIYDKCSIYFFYCLEEKRVIISQLEGKTIAQVALKKKCTSHPYGSRGAVALSSARPGAAGSVRAAGPRGSGHSRRRGCQGVQPRPGDPHGEAPEGTTGRGSP